MATPAEFDPNVWYAISEARVDNTTSPLKSTLQMTSGGLRVFGLVDRQWQMQPVDDEPGRYLMRYSGTGPGQQMAICHDPGELADSRSVACMARSSTVDDQKWDIVEWGDGTYRMHNVANGSSYALDVHPGSNLFMNGNIQGVNSDVYHVAQHWIWSSVKEINEGAYSTIYSASSSTNAAETTGAMTTTATDTTATDGGFSSTPTSGPADDGSSADAGGGLGAGAAAGIGVAATLAVVGLALAGVFLWWRRRRTAGRYSKTSNVDDSTAGGHDMQSAPPSHHYYSPPPGHGVPASAAALGQYPPSPHQAQSRTQQQLDRHPSVGGYYGHKEGAASPPDAATEPLGPFGQAPVQQHPHEAPSQQIHEAPAQWHAELDAQAGIGGGRPGSGSGSGMNSMQNSPAGEIGSMQQRRQVL